MTWAMLGVALAGCATPQAATQSQRDLRPGDAVRAEELFTLESRQVRFERSVGGRTQEVTFEMSPHDAGWIWAAEDLRAVQLLPDEDGDIAIAREFEPGEDSDVRYDPALLMLPATLEPNQPATAESRMTVLNAKGDATRAKGTCHVTVELLGRREVEAPAGRFDCVVLRTTRRIKLDLAEVEVEIHSAYAPGTGLIRQTIDRRTRALGLFGGTTREQLQRLP